MQATKYEAQDFNKEINHQNVKIEKLGDDFERAEQNMINVTTKMDHLLAISSHWTLIVIILVELAVLILIMLLM